MNRIISFYPLENRPALLSDLSASLKVIVSQRLVKNTKGGRSPASEVLLNTRHVADLIEKGEINEIKEAIDKSLAPGSLTFEQSLFKMYRDGTITQEEALANADSANNLLWLMNNADASLTQPQTMAPKPAIEQKVETAPSGASFSEFKLSLDDEKAA
jgi:twitching motility protein PilU